VSVEGPDDALFRGPFAGFYDVLYGAKDYAAECDVIERAIARHAGGAAHLLDVGCGTGGHAIPLARRGYRVTALDRSRDMLDVAAVSAARAGVADRVDFVHGDGRTARLPAADAAIMMFCVIGYLPTLDDVTVALRNIRAALSAGGLLLFDFWYGPAVRSDPPGQRWRLVEHGTRRVLRLSDGRVVEGTDTCEVMFRLMCFDGDRIVSDDVEHHRVRFFEEQQLRQVLRAARFDLVHLGAFPHDEAAAGSTGWPAFAVARAG
jgi:SAM-dependent methyltransferase